jgi:1,4-dihydroxy-2-naphthoyl-CoA hydrolase
MVDDPSNPAGSPAEDVARYLNPARNGWTVAMGVHFVRATGDEVVAEWHVGPCHLQPHGVVHGGVYAGVIEEIASVGAAIHAMSRGQSVVGLENHTSFLRAVREGKLRATARPLMRGRRTQVWEATVTDADGRVVATGRVRLLSLEPDAVLAGEKIGHKRGLASMP